MNIKSRRFLCKAIALIFLLSNLLTSMPDIQIVFAADKPDKEEKIKYEDREKIEIIVKYKAGRAKDEIKDRVKQSLKLAKMDRKKSYVRFNADLLQIGRTDDMSKVITMLKSDPDVEYVQPNYKLEIQTLPADLRFNEQWGLLNTGQEIEGSTGRAGVDINAVNAWNLTKGSAAVVVGLLDTGIDINHDDLKNSIFINSGEIAGNNIDDDNNGYIDDVNGWDFVNADNTVYDSGTLDLHGTYVAGIIAASADSKGITGVAPNIKILPLKFINGNWGYTCDAIDAIEYAMNMGVKIINCSFGGTENNFALKDTMVNSGILFVASAGNKGEDVAVSPVYPACFNIPNVLSVASIDSMGVISPYSSYGDRIHVAAPGINILSTTPDNTYDYNSGTSVSAPFVTGIAALLKSNVPGLSYEQLAQRIKSNVVSCTNLQGKVTSGGRVDANAALTNIKPPRDTYNGPGNDTGTVPGGQQWGNEDTWYTQEQLAKIKEKLHYGEGGVNPASGNYSVSSTDLSVPAPGFLINISRTYNSRDSKTAPLGQGWTFGFEGMAEGTDVMEVTLPSGGAQRFRLDKTTNKYIPEDSRSIFVKNADNTYTLTTKDQYKYYFNSSRYLYKMEDRNGNAVNIQVDSNGKITKITDAVGREFNISYKQPGNRLIDTITGPEGAEIKYEYDASNRLEKVTDAEGGMMRYSYDTWGFITEIKDHYEKSIVKLTYNHSEGENQHKVSQSTDSFGNIINYTYDMTNKKTTANDMNNRTYTYWFDSSMYTVREQDPEGRSTYTEYFQEGGKNKYGDIKFVTDRNGNKTQYEIDSMGNVTKIINPDLSFKEFAYDDKNNLVTEKDELQIPTFYIYDTDKKLLLKKAQPINGADQYTAGCDESGFAVTQYEYYTDSEAQSLFQTNAKGLLKSVRDPEGNSTIYEYDIDGNIKGVTDPELHKTLYTYNRLGLKTEMTSPKGYKTGYVNDKNGFMVKMTLDQGETTRIVYDMAGRKVQEVRPKQYDPAAEDPANHRYNDNTAGYRYSYYDSGLLKTETDPEDNTTAYTYDVYGNILTETRPDGSVLRYEHDIMDRLKKTYFRDSAEAPEVMLYEYSHAVLEDGRTQETETRYLNDAETAVTVEIYDWAGRLQERQYPDGYSEKTVYDQNGTVISTAAKDGSITYYKYDKLNRLSEQWAPMEYSEGSILYSYTKTGYDKSGRITEEKKGKQKVSLFEEPSGYFLKSYAYYAGGNVKTITDSADRRIEYAYDADGNLVKEEVYTDSNSKVTTEYTYNHLGKPAEKKLHMEAGDIYGNSFGSTADSLLLTTYTYDSNGNLETLTAPDGVTTAYTYDKMDRQLSTSQPGIDEEGAAATITVSTTYNWEGKPLTSTDANGGITGYEYDKRGSLIKITDARNGVTSYGYDRAGRKIIEVSPKNYDPAKPLEEMNRAEYVYDTIGRIKGKLDKYTDPGTGKWVTLNTRTYRYDAAGNLIKELDALGYETVYTYDLRSNVISVLDPVSEQRGLPFTSWYEYDALGRKTSATNAKGAVTMYDYDDAGNVLAVYVKKDAEAYGERIKAYTYDLAGRKLTETDGNGNTVTCRYNALGKERKITYPGDDTIDAKEVIFQYDVNGRLKYKRDSMDREELYTYDNQNRLLSLTEQREDGMEAITVEYRYDKNGNKRYETDGEGNTTEYIYDELNRLKETRMTVNGISKSTEYGYDANGNQTSMTDWLGNTYTNSYDPINRLIEKSDPYTIIQRLEYDKNSRQVKAWDALNNMTQYSYDRNGRLITTIDPENHITNQTYDDVGNIQSRSDGRGITTVYSYDEYNRLISVTNAKGETTSYTYDLNGNLLTQTDAKLQTTFCEYNAANKLVRRMDHGGRLGAPGSYTYILAKTEAYTYYADGSIKTKKDRNGRTTEYTYDIHGRLTEQRIGGDVIAYTYDNNGNQLTMRDGTGTTGRTYDEQDRVLTKTVPDIGTIAYQYDILEAEGCYSEISEDPGDNVTDKTFDRAGRLTEVTEGDSTTTYQYYDDGSRKNVTYPDGSREDYTYYKDGTLKTLENKNSSGTVIDSYSYTYDGARNQTTKTDSKGVTRYEYDGLNRLSKVTEPGGKTTSYLFDKAGNRTRETVLENDGSSTTTYSYNEQNRLTDTITTRGFVMEKVWYEYDGNGNALVKVKETTKPVDPELTGSFVLNKAGTITTREAAFMEYNVWNQMVKTIEGDKTITYGYNGEGYRVEKKVNDEITRYMYEADKVILEVDGEGNETARNVYGSSLLMRKAGAEQYYYMYNGHGDVTALLDTNGSIAATYYYDAFGNITEQTGEADNPIRYAGYQYDEETEIYYLNARYYDPKIARFLTEDSYRGRISDPLSLNLYTYCSNSPIMYIDPTGHWQKGDEKLPKWAQDEIKRHTDNYYDANKNGDLESAKISHDFAESIRDACNKEGLSNSSKNSGSSSKGSGSSSKDKDKNSGSNKSSSNKSSNDIAKEIVDTYQGMQIMQKYGYSGTAQVIGNKLSGLIVSYMKSTNKVEPPKQGSSKWSDQYTQIIAHAGDDTPLYAFSQGVGNSKGDGTLIGPMPKIDDIMQAAIEDAKLRIDALMWKSVGGRRINSSSIGAIYTQTLNQEIEALKNRQQTLAYIDLYMSYYKANGESMQKIALGGLDWMYNPEPGLDDTIKFRSDKVEALKEVVDMTYKNNLNYLVVSKSVRKEFVNELNKLEGFLDEHDFPIYDSSSENKKYKDTMINYVRNIRSMNENYDQYFNDFIYLRDTIFDKYK